MAAFKGQGRWSKRGTVKGTEENGTDGSERERAIFVLYNM